MTRPENTNTVLDAMRASLTGYVPRPDLRPLADLVSFLSGAIDALDGQVESAWVAELRSAWWLLEYVNAELLSEGRLTLTPDEVRSISDSRDEMLAVLLAVLLAGREATLSLTHDQALVLFDWLTRASAADEAVAFEHRAERRVLEDLESQLERQLVEPLRADYASLLDAARNRLGESTET